MNAVVPGQLVVISGPSGVGKSTVVREVLDRFSEKIRLSVSATTRPPRRGERDGVDYYFLTKEQFAQRKEAGDFLECIEVFDRGHWYGTLWSEVRSSLEAGLWVILEIDVEGAQDALEKFSDAITIFILPGDLEELERRLRSRGTEGEEAIERRLSVARRELQFADSYQYQIVNETVHGAVKEISQILESRGISHD